jgi:CubicO group peptidase (beta-lactamase class C family)
VLDGRAIVEALERQAPVWTPGTKHGYHAITYGWLIGEVVRRITGKPLGEVFAEEVAGPLGIDFFIGLPASEEHRVAAIVDFPPADPAALDAIPDPEVRRDAVTRTAMMADPDSTFSRALHTNGVLPTPLAAAWNRPEVHAAEMPAANGIANAVALAKLYAATIGEVDGVRILREETVAAAIVERVNGPDETLVAPTRFGTGFVLSIPPLYGWLSERSFGHAGAGGGLGFADPERGVGFGYVMNQMGGGAMGDPRTIDLIEALRAALDR